MGGPSVARGTTYGAVDGPARPSMAWSSRISCGGIIGGMTGLIRAITNIYKYRFEILNAVYLENA